MTKTGKEFISDITRNWNIGAIMDLTVTTDSNCPANYEEAYNYTWPGTSVGCSCKNSFFFYKYLLYAETTFGYCSTRQLAMGCSNVFPTSKKILSKWGSIDNKPTKICLKRSSETWFANAPLSVNQQCQDNNMTQCGISKENIFCTNETRCPINDVRVVNLNLASDPNASSIVSSCAYDQGCVVLSEDSSSASLLQFQRGDTFDALPTAEFRVNEYAMCRRANEDNITPKRTVFPLLSVWGPLSKGCGDGGKYIWNFTGAEMTETKFYAANGLSPTINSLMPFGYYEDGKSGDSYTWGLYTRTFIPWRTTCRNQMGHLVNQGKEIKVLEKIQLVLLIVGIIVTIFLAIIAPCCVYRYGRTSSAAKDMIVANYIGKFALLPVLVIAILRSVSISDTFADWEMKDCTHFSILETLNIVKQRTEMIYGMNLIIVCLLVAVLVFDAWHFKNSVPPRNEQYNPQNDTR